MDLKMEKIVESCCEMDVDVSDYILTKLQKGVMVIHL
jgi:hypothetical protein